MTENLDNVLDGFNKEDSAEEKEHKQRVEQKEAIDRIIRGVNDTFVKKYEFEDLGIDFTIKIQAPNALEIGQIQARLSSYLGGMNNYASEYMHIVYQTLATLRTTGKDIPEELAKDEDIYNLDILYQIGRDFQQWLSNFRF